MRIALQLLAGYGVFAAAIAVSAAALKRPLGRFSLILFVLLPVIFLLPGFMGIGTPVPVDHVFGHFPPWTAQLANPHNPSLNDVATQFAPWAKAVRMAWREGSLPFWDRWNGCGMPLAANGVSQAFSPFTMMMLVLPLANAFVLLAAAKLFLALSGMWLWLRELGTSVAAARFGAVLFGFSFAMTPWLYHPASAVICLWPWVFFAIELLAEKNVSKRALIALVVLFTTWCLCGHLETVAVAALFGAIWFSLRAVARTLPSPRRMLSGASLAAMLALGLSAFSSLPQLETVRASNRLVLATSSSHFNYVPWVPYHPGWLGGFVTSLFPRAFGDGIDSPMIAGAAGSIVEMGFGYFGVIGWGLALLVLRPGSRRSPNEWILFALVLFGLGAAMGLPILRNVTEALPGIRLLPPLRLLLLVSVAGAPLAALELDRLVRDLSGGRRVFGIFASASLSIAALAILAFALLYREHAAVGGVRSQVSALAWTLTVLLLASAAAVAADRKIIWAEIFTAMITGLAALELMHQGMRLYRFYPSALFYPETPLIRFLHSQPLPYRVVGDGRALFPNTNVFAAVENIATHDPAERRDYVEFLNLGAGYPPFDYFKAIANLNSPALDFLNVRYLVTPPGRSAPGPKWKLVYAGSDGTVFENSDALPRLFTPPTIEFVSPVGDETDRARNAVAVFGQPLRALLAIGAFRERAIVLEGSLMRRRFGDSGPNGVISIRDFQEETNRVHFAAAVSGTRSGAIVVGSLVNDGGWSAQDESGARLAVGLANGPFLALCLPPGDHVITLNYTPPGFRLGAWISSMTLLAFVIIVGVYGRRRTQLWSRR
jgi:hypothetical protein